MSKNSKVELDVRLNMDEMPKDFNKLEKEAKSGAEVAADALDDVQKSVDQAAKKTKESAENMKSASDKLIAAIRSQESELADLKKAYLNTALEQGKSSEEAKALENRIDQLSSELADNKAKLKDAEYSVDDYGQSLQELSEDLDNAKEKASVFGDVLKGTLVSAAIEKGTETLLSGIDSAVSETLELQDANQKLAASTGASAGEMEAYSEVMEDLYKSNYGDSIGDVADSMALVRQYTGEVDPTKLQELTENAMALDDTFENMDLEETIRGVDALMGQMGLSAEEAFDYITVGAQNGLNKSNELTDNLAEYVPLWSQAGFSAKEMFTIMDNGLKSGAYNLDKVNDFVKEFGISLSDERIEQNIGSFSEGTQALFEQWKNGEATTRDVFYSVISDLSSMTNQQEALTLASSLWSSLGEDNAMAVITAFDDVNATFVDVKGSMESLKEVRYDSVTNQYEELGRTMQLEVIEPILEDFLPDAQKGMKVFADNIDTIIPVAKTAGAMIATIWVTKKSKQFITDIKDTTKAISSLVKKLLVKTTATAAETAAETASTTATVANTAATTAQTTATGAATVAQTGLNAAMLANPVVLLTAGIIAAGVAFVSFTKDAQAATTETESLRESANALNEEMQQSQTELRDSLASTKEAVETTTASVEAMRPVAEELAALADQESYTNEESDRMVTLVTQLKAIYPEMGIEIDNVTGKLSMGSEEILNYINNLENMAEADAYQQGMQESIDAATQAIKERTLVEAELNPLLEEQHALEKDINTIEVELEKRSQLMLKSQEELNKMLEEGTITQEDYTRALEGATDSTIEYKGEQRLASELLSELTSEQQKNEKTIEDLTKTIDGHNEAIEDAQEQSEIYAERYNELTAQVEAATAAEQANAETVAAASKASIEVAGQELEAYSSLSAEQQQLAVDVTNSVLTMQDNVQSALESQMNMFEKFDGGTKISTEKLLANMESQIVGVQQWEQNLAALVDRGINEDLLQNLAAMGPEAANYVQTFVNMSDEEFARANELWGQSVQIKGMTDQWGQELTQSVGELSAGGVEAFGQLGEDLNMQMNESGIYGVQGLVDGMVAAQTMAEEASEDLGVKVIDSLNEGLGCHSPSVKAKESGGNTDQGLIDGIKNKLGSVKIAGKKLGTTAIEALENCNMYSEAYSLGVDFSDGLKNGIGSKANEIAQQAASVVRAALIAAKTEQDSNSPAKETIKLGHDFGDGNVIGIRDKIPDVSKASADMVDAALSAQDNRWAIDAINDAVYSRSMSAGRIYTQETVSGQNTKANSSADDVKRLAEELGEIMAGKIGKMEFIFNKRPLGRMVRSCFE